MPREHRGRLPSTRRERRRRALRRCAGAAVLLAVPLLQATLAPAATGQERPANSEASNPTLRADLDHCVAAVRAAAAPRIDGDLDDPVWGTAVAVGGFVQSKPDEGAPASERTEVRIAYDQSALYVSAVLYDREPGKITATVLRRDQAHTDNDALAVTLDTYHDHRNGYLFETNPLGAQYDAQIIGEAGSTTSTSGSQSRFNESWDAVWDVAARITPDGWVVEMAIPFWSLRFDRAAAQEWGINVRRTIRRRNEESYWAPVPRNYGIARLSLSGLLTGLEGLQSPRNVQVKPFAIGGLAQFGAASDRPGADDLLRDAGLDVKWGLTPSLTMDVTLNTDFSQVEADDEQINLTRFSLFFPEKREFFLENAGLFELGGSIGGPIDFVGAGMAIGFHPRRIGISDDGREVPLIGGGRLTGNTGPWSLGMLSIQTAETGDEPSTNYSVARVSRNLGRRSKGGVLFTNKQTVDGHVNRVVGLDTRLALKPELTVDAWWMKSSTTGRAGASSAAHVMMDWSTPLVQVTAAVMDIGDDFNPEIGFVNRTGVRIHDFLVHVTPYPKNDWVRNLNPHAAITYNTDQGGRLLTRNVHLEYDMTFKRGEKLGLAYNRNFEQLDAPFTIYPGVLVPAGAHLFSELDFRANSDASRALSGSVRYVKGTLYDGDFTRFTGRTTVRAGSRFSAQLSWTRNDVVMPAGAFATDLVRLRAGYDFSPRLALSGLLQYNSRARQFLSNVRLNFIHTPGADFFLVYNERYLTDGVNGAGGFIDRAVVAKLTHLLRF